MIGKWASIDGELVPAESAAVPIDDINFAYGFGVYETLKVRRGVVYFPELHEERLFASAGIISLEHPWRPGTVLAAVESLVRENGIADCNIKILLIGASTAPARLYIMALNPLYPKRSDVKSGGVAVTFEGERLYPRAKSLSMLVSSIAFRRAQAAGAYDALLVNRHGEITEGTRTNLFVTDGTRVFTPPADQVLEGVTKLTVAKAIEGLGLSLEERSIPLESLTRWQGLFLTSTSTKVMALRRVDELTFDVPPVIEDIRRGYDAYLDEYARRAPRIVKID